MPRLTKAAIEQLKRERKDSQLLLERIASGFRVQRDEIDVTEECLTDTLRKLADLDVILARNGNA